MIATITVPHNSEQKYQRLKPLSLVIPPPPFFVRLAKKEQWFVVFGKDRANRLGAESLTDAVEDIDREKATNEGRGRNVEVDMNNNLDNGELDDNPVEEGQSNNSPTHRTESSVSKGTRKRKISSTDSLNESMAKISRLFSIHGR